jgi:hypothetical protein
MPGNAQPLFICYRRADTGVIGGRIHDLLTRRLRADRVFMDVYANQGGEHWNSRVRQALNAARILLPLIGPDWEKVSLPNEGRPRLWNQNDLVRQEIEAAVKENKEIVPLLIDRKDFPKLDCIPRELHPIFDKHALSISSDQNFVSEMDALLKRLDCLIFCRRDEIACTVVRVEHDSSMSRAKKWITDDVLKPFGIKAFVELDASDLPLESTLLNADLVVLLGASLAPEIAYLLGRRFELGRKPALLIHTGAQQIQFPGLARYIPYDSRKFDFTKQMMEQALNEFFPNE